MFGDEYSTLLMVAAAVAAARGLHKKEQQVHSKQRWRGSRASNALVGLERPHCGPTMILESSEPASSGEWLAVLEGEEYTWTGSKETLCVQCRPNGRPWAHNNLGL